MTTGDQPTVAGLMQEMCSGISFSIDSEERA